MEKKTNYKNINIRDFRRDLTSLKDSLEAGVVYKVLDRGRPLAYFVPADYEMKLKKKEDISQEEFRKAFKRLKGRLKIRGGATDDYKARYHELLLKKYLP